MSQASEKQFTFFKTWTEAFISLARHITHESEKMQSLSEDQKSAFYESFYISVLEKMQEWLDSFDKIEK